MKQAPSEKDKQRFKKAMKFLEGGRPGEALKLFLKVRKSWGDDPDIGYLEGLAYGKLGDLKSIVTVSNRVLNVAPEHFGALSNMANAQMGLGKTDLALEYYDKALKINPEAPEVLDNYARAITSLGRRDEAIDYYKKAIAIKPGEASTHALLGRVYAESGKPDLALHELNEALNLDSGLSDAHTTLGELHVSAGRVEQAEVHFKKALELGKQNFVAYMGLSNVKRCAGEYDKGLEYLQSAATIIGGDDAIVKGLKANLLQRKGENEQVYEIINSLIADNKMKAQAISVFSRICHKYDRCDEALSFITDMINETTTDIIEKQSLMYSAGDLLDKQKRYDEAFKFYREANSLVDIKFDRNQYTQQHDELIECFSKLNLSKFARSTTGSSRPVFVLGMPRSGTSLIEQILSSHHDVHGAGELNNISKLEDYVKGTDTSEQASLATKFANIDADRLTHMANAYLDKLKDINPDTKYVVDKMPHNFLQIGLISLLFPEAKIIHCVRNPLDNCLSIYFQAFIWAHDYAVDLSNIGFFYNEYQRIMKHWDSVIDLPMLTVKYEDMISDQEAMTRKLLDFCDLEWDESVMKFYDSKRDVGTASYDQVRQPIYQTSKERWKNYEKHLAPLMSKLKSV